MLDPMTSLAFSVYSGKGVYALLLGSGISTSAGVPTGWGIILDLIRKVAAVEKKGCGDDPGAVVSDHLREGPGLFRTSRTSRTDPRPSVNNYCEAISSRTSKNDRKGKSGQPPPPRNRQARGRGLHPRDRDDEFRPADGAGPAGRRRRPVGDRFHRLDQGGEAASPDRLHGLQSPWRLSRYEAQEHRR